MTSVHWHDTFNSKCNTINKKNLTFLHREMYFYPLCLFDSCSQPKVTMHTSNTWLPNPPTNLASYKTLQSLQYSVSSTAHKSHTVDLSLNDQYMQKLRKFQIIQISVYTVWLYVCILSVWIAALTASELVQTSHSM